MQQHSQRTGQQVPKKIGPFLFLGRCRPRAWSLPSSVVIVFRGTLTGHCRRSKKTALSFLSYTKNLALSSLQFSLTQSSSNRKLSFMFTFGFANTVYGFDPLVLLLIALLLDSYLGETKFPFKQFHHPVEIIGMLIGWFDRKLNRDNRSNVDRAFRGALVVFIIVILSAIVGWGASWLTQNHSLGWILELFFLTAMLAGRGLYDSVRAVGIGLEKSLEKGREAVSHIAGRSPKHLDEHGVARAAIESCAENFSDGLVAPVFWYVLFGLPGLLVYKAVNTMDSMIGHMTPKYRAFGMTAARLDDILNLIPARLSGLFLVLAATVTPKAHPLNALKIMLRDASKHRSMNAGWPEGAAAGALNLALAGPRHYHNTIVNDPWLGDGSARTGVKDIRNMLYLYVSGALINGAWVAALAVIRLN